MSRPAFLGAPLPVVRCQPKRLAGLALRAPSRRRRDDMLLLAHIRKQQRLSLNGYGWPRVTAELQELGVPMDELRVGRLMKEIGIYYFFNNEI